MENAYNQLEHMRDMLSEPTAAHWTDRELLKNLNMAQRRIGQALATEQSTWLYTSATVTFVASEADWPADCAKPVYLEEVSSGNPVPFSTEVQDRSISRTTGTMLYAGVSEAYMMMNKLIVNQSSYAAACTLWYQIRVPDLHVGTASAGGALSITLSAHDGAGIASGGFGAKLIADYYTLSKIEVVSGTGASTGPDRITDYSVARAATVTGTYANDSVYGTISRLPEECHDLMILEAVKYSLAKPSAAIDPKYYQYIKDLWDQANDTFTEWCSSMFVSGHRTRITEVD